MHKGKLSCVQLFVTPWSVAHQAPLSMGFSQQEYWSGLSLLQVIKPMSTALQADFLLLSHWEAYASLHIQKLFFLSFFYMDPFQSLY